MRRPFSSLLLRGALVTTTFVLPLSTPLAAQSGDIIGTARSAGQFATLLAAVDAAELTRTLRGKGPFTVFAPTDEAFRQLPEGTVESLLRPENRDKLKEILLYHVVAGKVPASTARTLSSAPTVEGRTVRIRAEGSRLRINNAVVLKADVGASNGVIHVIDQVLLPPAAEGRSEMSSASTTPDAAREARRLISFAIERGVPLFNNGQAAATLAVYEVAARGVLAIGDGIPLAAQRAIERGLSDAAGERNEEDRAWVLRRALDDASRSLAGRGRMSTNAH